MTQGERSQLAREWLWETWQEKGERRGEKKFKERESIFAPICEKSPRCPLAKISFFCSSSSCSPEPPAWKLGRMKAKEEVGEGPSRAAAAGCGSRSRAWLSALAAAPHHGPGSTSEPAELQGGSRGDGKEGKGGMAGELCCSQLPGGTSVSSSGRGLPGTPSGSVCASRGFLQRRLLQSKAPLTALAAGSSSTPAPALLLALEQQMGRSPSSVARACPDFGVFVVSFI